QAEDGIRDRNVTGVQTCALPIFLNLIFGVLAYKLGFAKELPLLKSIIVYIMLAMGMFVISIFSIARLPMTETLIIISLVLGIYRYRLYKDRQTRNQEV